MGVLATLVVTGILVASVYCYRQRVRSSLAGRVGFKRSNESDDGLEAADDDLLVE